MRVRDLPRLAILQLPVRCHVCLHRRFANLFSALTLREKSSRSSRRTAGK
jgi:hypothetical protein